MALIAPWPGPTATAPPSHDAAPPMGPGPTLLADDGSLTGQRTAGAPLTHPQIPQRVINSSVSVFPSVGVSFLCGDEPACTAQRFPGTVWHPGTTCCLPERPELLTQAKARSGLFSSNR